MADFKTHTLVGSAVGISLGFVTYAMNWSNQLYIFALIYIISIIGSFLPDLDSDSGRPLRIIFTFLGIVGSLLTFLITYFGVKLSLRDVILYTVLTYFAVRYIVSHCFKKFTKHRGIFHSIPMGLVLALITLFIVCISTDNLKYQIIITLSVFLGFISHLILDEIFATKSFIGIPYKVSDSFGNALKFYSKSKTSTFLTYLFLAGLILLNVKTLIEICKFIS